MSLINRIEISNFVCLFGPDAADDEWSPQFRHNLLDLHSQSSAISMPNGMGKTSLADGVIAVLSRDRALVTRTKEKMSPSSCGSYSHIRVELNIPSVGSTNDMLVAIGQQVPGEMWVFGVCGFRGKSQSVTFYYYKGVLEDCPVAKVDGHHITLMSNADFKQSRENVSGLRFGVPESDWTEAITPHFPAHTLTQMAHFQKNGGGDTASSIYNITRKGSERYHESFFYSIIAPELMSGAMNDEDDDGDEHYLEATFMKSGRAYIRAKNETIRREKSLKRDERTLEVLGELSDKAQDALALGEEAQKLFAKIGEEAGIINQLIKQRFIGIPFTDEFPAGKIGELAKGIVVVPQAGPVIQDHVLARLLGKNTGHLNRDAMNSGVESVQITQPIEIIMDLAIQDYSGIDRGGHSGKGYNLEQSIQILDGRESDIDVLRAAFQWFGTTVDTNPYRRKSESLAHEVSLLCAKLEDCKKMAGEAASNRTELEATIKRVDSLRDAWQSLNALGCFNDEELAHPMATCKLVKDELEEAHESVIEHRNKVELLNGFQDAYRMVINEFGEHANPGDILNENNNKHDESKRQLHSVREDIEAATGQQEAASGHTKELLKQSDAAIAQLNDLKKLASDAEQFSDMFGDESPDGLEKRVCDEKKNHIHRQGELKSEIKQFASKVESLHLFRTEFGNLPPSEWLVKADDQHRKYIGQLNEAENQKSDLERRLEDLKNERVSPSSVADKALQLLAEEGLSCSPLHDVIRSASLEEGRKREVLSYFSALLFAPVFESGDDAANAARVLFEKDMSVPVFLHSELKEFASRGTLSSGVDGLVYDHQGGICTRTVECIIDPSLIERERSDVSASLTSLKSVISDIKSHLQEVSPSSQSVCLAQLAKEAEENGYESHLELLKGEYQELEGKTELIETRASDHAIQLIRSMHEFTERGGKEHLESVAHRVDDLREQVLLAEEAEVQLKCEISALKEKRNICEREVEKFTLSTDIVVALTKAKAFLDADGSSFLASSQNVEAELNDWLDLARRRNVGEHIFKNAAEFLNTKDADFEKIQTQIVSLREQEKALLEEAKAHEDKAGELSESRSRLRAFESSLDFAVAELLDKYKHLRSLPEIRADGGEKSELVAQALRFTNECGQSNDTDSETINQITESLKAMNIKRNAGDARRIQKQHVKSMKEFSSSVDNMVARESLSPSMKTALKMNKDNPSETVSLKQRFSVDFEKSKEIFEDAKNAEEKVRNQARERLVSFCDDARDNLRRLQDVLKKGEAKLEVRAKVSDVDTLGNVVDSIMAVIENEEEHFQKTKDGTRGEEDKYKTTLVSKIRDRIYRGIFSSPRVTMSHPDIHGGRSTSISPKMSAGQRTAVSLMVMSKLAEYSMLKESIRNASSYVGRRKAITKSTSVLIIDGLFSNLSKASLIKKSMASLKASRGNFQLIGLIHWPQYENNPEIFPTYIIGKEVSDLSNNDGVSGFVYTEDSSQIIPPKKLGRVPGELDSVGYHVSQ